MKRFKHIILITTLLSGIAFSQSSYNIDLIGGKYKVPFTGNNLPSGIYFYKLETNGFTEARKMVLIK
jgi:hypothetical protein